MSYLNKLSVRKFWSSTFLRFCLQMSMYISKMAFFLLFSFDIFRGKLAWSMHKRINFGRLPVQNKPNKIETYIEICKRKKKSTKKEYLRLFVHKAYSTIGILSIYHSVLSFTEKSCTLLKHRNLLARVDVCYLWKTTWL